MKKKNAPGILSRLFVISPAPPPHSCSHVVPVLLVGKVVTKEIEKKNLRGVWATVRHFLPPCVENGRSGVDIIVPIISH